MLQERSRVTSALSLKKPNEQSSFASSVSCLINCADSTESSEHVLRNKSNSARSMISRDNLSRKRVRNSHSFECDESISGSYPSSSQKPEFQTLHRSVQLLKSSNNLPLKQVYMFQADPTNKDFSPPSDSDDSVDSSNELSPKNPKQHKTPRRSLRLLNFIGDYLPRLAIPVGPRFQADIPDWTGPVNRENSSADAQCNSEDSRWLGTKIWSIEDKNTENSSERIGKGRPYSCSCNSSGSLKCIKLHVFEKRRQLQDDLGPAFFSWRFDEMGEDVSKSWTLKEQKSFNILVSKSNSFLKPALNQLTSKCRKSIVSYYFNVFLLRLMSKQTRLASKIVDSDDDEEEAFDMGSSSTHKKTQYLIRGR
ncbi:ELM2 domain [Macleaya cordata]|uniref:ELM2 domain n=1 Tax=Macleaya cordata TaxID=56857 RepID=A0A200R4Q2_MACCD|nr:ELM2 domain [Macleaya cordata]